MRKTIALTLFAAFALASCGKSEEGGSSTSSSANIAPPAGKQWTEIVERTPEGGYRMGNPDAPIKLIEYGSRTCSHCAAFAMQGEPVLKAKYVATGKVSYEFRDMIGKAPDVAAMLLGECGGPDIFFPILAQMFAAQSTFLDRVPPEFPASLQGKSIEQQAAAWAEVTGYLAFVVQRGVPEGEARKCLADGARIAEIDKRLRKASADYHIEVTPTFILNGSKLETAGNWQQLEPRLTEAGA
jgi:protein-disulfide isomerase